MSGAQKGKKRWSGFGVARDRFVGEDVKWGPANSAEFDDLEREAMELPLVAADKSSEQLPERRRVSNTTACNTLRVRLTVEGVVHWQTAFRNTDHEIGRHTRHRIVPVASIATGV